MVWGPTKLVDPAVATHPATPARRSLTTTGPSEPVTVWALELPDAVPRLTDATGAPGEIVPPACLQGDHRAVGAEQAGQVILGHRQRELHRVLPHRGHRRPGREDDLVAAVAGSRAAGPAVRLA